MGVCHLVFDIPLPERQRRLFPYIAISYPRQKLSILAGLPSLLPPILPDKRKRKGETKKNKRKGETIRVPPRAYSANSPPWPRPPAAPRPPFRPPPESPSFLGSRPREGLTPCAPCAAGRVAPTLWPTAGAPSSPRTHWPGRGVAPNSSWTWPPRARTHGLA